MSIAGGSEDGAATGDLDATSTITIQGRGSTVDAAGLDRAFDALAASLTVDGLTVVAGAPPETQSGGGYRSTGTLVISNSLINGNTVFGAGASGGGVINNAGSLSLSNSGLDGNPATRAGGAIEANLGTTMLDRVSLSANATGPTPGNGGGLHLTGTGSVTVTNSAVSGNTATEEGGGLWNSSTGTFSVSGPRSPATPRVAPRPTRAAAGCSATVAR